MARTRTPRHKISRRFGVDIYGTGGAVLARRLTTPPGGIRPGRRRRQSEYALQLREKQKVRALYGVREGQFRRYYAMAARQPGITGENLLQLLERRLDNVVYRLGFARSRPMARQLVSHRHIRVDGHPVNIPSYLVQPGQTISLSGAAATMPPVLEELHAGRPVPPWLERAETSGRVLRWPQGDEIDVPANMDLLLAFYSR
jgi:small subunit ribosomal protein S4